MNGGVQEYVMGVMMDKDGNPVSGRNNSGNSNFIGTLTYPADGTNPSKTFWTDADGGIPFSDTKYYDKYAYGEDDVNYNRRILGDATGEMGPFGSFYLNGYLRQVGSWYQDEARFVSSLASWFVRGSYYGSGLDAGVFAFSVTAGQASSNVGFRTVLIF